MKEWKTNLRRYLRSPASLRVLTSQSISSVAQSVGLPIGEPRSMQRTVERTVRELEAEGSLIKIKRALWINQLCQPPTIQAEAASFLRKDAVVSMQTVLGDKGILNNWTHQVTSVVPFSPNSFFPRTGFEYFENSTFHFHALPLEVIEAGNHEDRLQMLPYKRATPEAAFVHWIYLEQSPFNGVQPIPADIDTEELDTDRLYRLAKILDIEGKVNDILNRSYLYWNELEEGQVDAGYAF